VKVGKLARILFLTQRSSELEASDMATHETDED